MRTAYGPANYNQEHLEAAETRSSARSLIVLAGAIIGFVQGLRYFGPQGHREEPSPNLANQLGAQLGARIGTIEARILQVEAGSARAVSRDELEEGIHQAISRLEETIENRFARQDRAAEALRSMIAETDQMLERVLEGLDMLAETRQKIESAAGSR